MLEAFPASLIEGVLRKRPEDGARRGVLRQVARNRSPREAREVARQALRPGCEELAARIQARRSVSDGGGRRRKRRPEAQNRHGGAPRGARPALRGPRRRPRPPRATSRAPPPASSD